MACYMSQSNAHALVLAVVEAPAWPLVHTIHPPRTHADVEDITSKTGSFKKFSVFVRMLISAARQQSDSVFMDLLTYQDLEALKSKKQQQGGAAAAAAAARPLPTSSASKRYLILTYASEFDRVHYPLPLTQEEGPDPGRLMEVIQKLRSEVARLQSSGGGGASSKRGSGGGVGRVRGVRDAGRHGGAGRDSDGVAVMDDVDEEEDVLDARRSSGDLASSSASVAVLAQRLEAVSFAVVCCSALRCVTFGVDLTGVFVCFQSERQGVQVPV